MAILEHPAPGRPIPAGGQFGASRGFVGLSAPHNGLDFSGPVGTPILAAAAGVVSKSAFSVATGAGHHVHVDHGNGIETRYAHLSSRAVRAGQQVVARQMIGGMGSSGLATGSHLHFEVIHNGEGRDPAPYLGLAPGEPAAAGADAPARYQDWLAGNRDARRYEDWPPGTPCGPGYHKAILNPTVCVSDELWNPLETFPKVEGELFNLVVPPLLEPAANLAILGAAALLVWSGLNELVRSKP